MLPQSFYNQKTLKVAQDLLGCFLIRKIGNKTIRAKIIETEGYNGPRDKASHASRGMTERNKVMFASPGTIYVYFTYGMHNMFNIVTESQGYPAAVLIRGVEVVGKDRKLTNGPAKMTKFLNINKSFNEKKIFERKNGLWIEEREEKIKSTQIKKTPRIGIDYAEEYKDKLWRYLIT
ncbi:hypothetical protein A2331_06615 [Candidatus Falkowbacteria bacterium RIFOXYB2_FULL_34_18]|uniref:Putative 3-methyladenine DNA glycosylase n=1 Tax=Candidatus Falkowbacteria bacterium RIFOXYD2_FULL_34_120 TaxID=1798007 RepID=A0A1F5TRA4_9BACT|nr:MAG: hypothetical protein A2331_06615 [Candidatus Falkowbacteria bacterium RIFOXYB2_FULL_34_18]OGF30006.1 MAG: hypothetical protein A2500_04065 [Candidatus Falkowbacteria bacterium RIFOXYC12_FULL_34_55]OGF37137.1 MAG: hypothetical protein A2466_02455 [Candidatus Falkowbacteria bacterium RIFOXYC2_FULL_34_220]OGF39542.1 MAG: hypothetical protein A2515_04430 [Candidatus Falkowbacteria bacterium RIFOXYD12_FULL_34_57]OGF41475.1 MAG: hypothetical protein A2531_02170 [Candidatus Falkowbacteria bact